MIVGLLEVAGLPGGKPEDGGAAETAVGDEDGAGLWGGLFELGFGFCGGIGRLGGGGWGQPPSLGWRLYEGDAGVLHGEPG